MIKEAFLNSEKERIKEFLLGFDLNYESNVDLTLYIEEDGKIIGTISKEKYIIKCLAVDKNYQGENLASTLVSEMVSRIIYEGKTYYQVFTKREYLNTFLNLGFSEIYSTDKTSVLESNSFTIDDYLKKEIKRFNIYTDDLASVVVNCNPITKGHLYLIEKASKEHEHVLVFVLEEEKSFFTFEERISLVYLATRHLGNVTVLPSSHYIISSLTFPSYFLKDKMQKNYEFAKVDVGIFKKYFMKYFNIKYRYVGSETDEVMKIYNDVLKEELGNNLIIVPRLDNISASMVRKYIEDGNSEKALEYIPEAIHTLFLNIASNK